MSDKVLTLVPRKNKDVKVELPQPITIKSLKRSDSFTGLSSLRNGVNDLESLVNDQRTALDQMTEQIKLQNELILSYQKILEEHETLFNSIIDG